MTAEDYYRKCVGQILNSVINTLFEHKERKFIWVETMFFEMWWTSAPDEMKRKLRTLIDNKQWEFIFGGWCSNDEATTTYTGIVDQITLGHIWLKKFMNVTPTTGFQIDPFGYSAGMATLINQIGFRDHIICRIGNDVKSEMRNHKAFQFWWKSSTTDPTLKTHTLTLPNHYQHFKGFNWEASCAITWTKSEAITPQNLKAKSEYFVQLVKESTYGFKHKHVIYPFGDDFTHMIATHNFGNLTLIMNYVNSHPELGVHMKWSLLTEYLAALPRENLPERKGDFFPYNDYPISWWTGYYSSYPQIKEKTRYGEQVARWSNFIHSFSLIETRFERNEYDQLLSLAKANAQLQHHDGITGTSRLPVRIDYLKKLSDGTLSSMKVVENSLTNIIKSENGGRDFRVKQSNIWFCIIRWVGKERNL
jgi:hypothetical protein